MGLPPNHHNLADQTPIGRNVPMAIEFACACGKKLSVGDEHAGKRAKCPSCQEPVQVPVAAPELSAEDAAFQALMEAPEPKEAGPKATRATRPEPTGERPPAPPPPPFRTAAPSERALAGVEPEPPRARREKRPRRNDYPEYDDQHRPRFALSPGMIGGIVGFLIGAAWLILGLMAGRLFIWPFVMMGFGFVAIVRGLPGHSEE